MEGVDADPLELEARVAPEQRRTRGITRSGCVSAIGVGVPAELEVDAPHLVRLLVQQHGLVRVEGRVEPEPALGREVGLHVTSAIRKRSRKVRPLLSSPIALRIGLRAPSAATSQSQRSAYSPSGVATVSETPSAVGSTPGDLVLPAEVEVGQRARPLEQVAPRRSIAGG